MLTPRLLLPALAPLFFTAAMAQTPPLPDPAELPPLPAPPEVLVQQNGERVSTREQWEKQRVPELKRLFQHYEYGYLPAAPAKVEARLLREDRSAFGGKATLKEVTLTWGMPDMAIQLMLVVPNARQKPAPVFLGLNFTGNHTLVSDPQVRLPDVWMSERAAGADHRAGDEDRGKHIDTWNIEQTIDRGYAVATFFNGDVVPDNAKLAEAVLAKFRGAEGERGPADAGTIAVWAWCLMRGVDYLVTDGDLDPKRIAVVGHSRNGKTALVAAAFDERIAMVIPSQAGCGGTAPCRVPPELAALKADGRPTVETLSAINGTFPHWFCGNFKKFNADPSKLPFDQHALIALCAPRPVLISNATGDVWANPPGQWEMLRAADPAYRLAAGEGAGAEAMPEEGKLLASRLGFFIRPGRHAMTKAEWDAWLDYADRWLR
jgi:hypothetical protein